MINFALGRYFLDEREGCQRENGYVPYTVFPGYRAVGEDNRVMYWKQAEVKHSIIHMLHACHQFKVLMRGRLIIDLMTYRPALPSSCNLAVSPAPIN